MNISSTFCNSYLILQAQGFIKGKLMKISVLFSSPHYALILWHCSWVRQLPLVTQEFIRRLCLRRGFVSQPHRLGLTWNLPCTVFDCICALHLALVGNVSGEGQVLPRKDCFFLGLFEDLVETWNLTLCWKRKVIIIWVSWFRKGTAKLLIVEALISLLWISVVSGGWLEKEVTLKQIAVWID